MEPEFRQDDITDSGWCPICGRAATSVLVDMSGICPEHGRVWLEWEPPQAVPTDEEDEE